MYRTIPIEHVVPAEDNVRRKLGDIKELAASIASVGVIEPLLVTPRADGRFSVVAGHRRLAAAVEAELHEVPCVVKELSDVERLETMIAENLARQALNPIEEAQAYFRMVELAVPVKDLARRLGRPPKHITARLALLELPRPVQTKVEKGSLGVSDASALLALKEHPDVISDLLSDDWDSGDLERAVIREVARIESDARRAAATDALAAQGVKVIEEWSRFGGGTRQPVALGPGTASWRLTPMSTAASHVTPPTSRATARSCSCAPILAATATTAGAACRHPTGPTRPPPRSGQPSARTHGGDAQWTASGPTSPPGSPHDASRSRT
jgi:ParB/RepB/Spo0J family partition protein